MKPFILGLIGALALTGLSGAAAAQDQEKKESVWVMTYTNGGG